MTDENTIPCENGGRDWRGVLTSQRMPRVAVKHQRPGRGKEEFSPTGYRRNMTLPTPSFQTSSFRNLRQYISAVLSRPVMVPCYSSHKKKKKN